MPSRDPTIKRLQSQRYRETHKEYIRLHQRGRKRVRTAYQRAWFASHREKKAAYNEKYRQWHRAALLERKRAWHKKNRARICANLRARYAANRASALAASSAYQKKNPHKVRVWRRRGYYKDVEKTRAYKRNWAKQDYAKNRERHIAKAIVREAARHRLIQLGSVEDRKQAVVLITQLRASPDTCCAYCGVSLAGKSVHIDHIIPLSQGGKHAVGNLCASCRTCNSSKNGRTPEQWREAMKDANA